MYDRNAFTFTACRYSEAKALGERVNTSRVHISKPSRYMVTNHLHDSNVLSTNGTDEAYCGICTCTDICMAYSCTHIDLAHILYSSSLLLLPDKLKSQIEKQRVSQSLQSLTGSSPAGTDPKEEALRKDMEAEKAKYVNQVYHTQ